MAANKKLSTLTLWATPAATDLFYIGKDIGGGLFESNKTKVSDLFSNIKIPSAATAGLQLYNTVDQTTNYERVEMRWVSNLALIQTAPGGSGATRGLSLRSVSSGGLGAALDVDRTSGAYFRFIFSGSIGPSFAQFGATGTSQNAATSSQQIFISITPSYNQASGTAANTDLKISRTEVALGSGEQNFIACYAGAAGTTEKYRVNNLGDIIAAGTIKTGAPGGAAGAWKLGSITAGAVALDAANYIEVSIGGTVKKLLIAA